MHGRKLCLALSGQFAAPAGEQIRLFAQTGFEGFFAGWERGSDLRPLRRAADETGMLFQSVHAPFTKMNAMWFTSEKTQAAQEELIECVRACSDNGVPLMVAHAYIGFEMDTQPTQEGVDRFGLVVDEARRLGVQIAFENTEGERFLAALMDCFTEETVGFCWDTGHQLCYNPDTDMMARYGHRLLGTHLNDNLGVKDFAGEITWLDDLHLLPFDGVTDWASVAGKLRRSGFDGPLTFELNTLSKPDRHENDAYARMDLQEYLAQAYMRACRVAALVQRAE